ncbi:MAG TPA: amidohydrolase family protein, partial [Thermoanaerobaculia bacterium]|nr:amidohydrolase family protein [Thermoanaerobaculia bacterium]
MLPSSPAAVSRPLLDVHTHLASLDYIPLPFIEGVAHNLAASLASRGMGIPAARLIDRLVGSLQDPDGSQQLAEMAAAGISRSVLLIADLTWVFKSPLSLEEIFVAHRSVAARHPDRFVVFGGVDPRWGRDGIELFERAVAEWGFAGLKLYPPCGYSPSDEGLFPLYEICAQRGLPVLLHTGPTSPALSFAFSSPFHVDEAARRFPTVNFILAHGAVHHVEEAVMLCEYRPNVHMDLSGLQGKLAVEGATGYYSHVFRRGLSHKILFGTDWPLFRLQGDQKSFVGELLGAGGLLADLPGNDLDLILCRNC